jgi:hypothetical protein
MRRLVFIGLAWLSYLASHGQNLNRIEYFIDTEPGYGNGTSVDFTAAPGVTDLTFPVPIDGVADGFHSLYVRSRDANNMWSVVQARPFYKLTTAVVNLPEVNKIEYFVDADPGYGLATDLAFPQGSDVTDLVFSVPVDGVSDGFHSLSIRSRDANGKWSVVQNRPFYKLGAAAAAAPDLNRMEYFVDADPGFGLATEVVFPQGNNATDFVFDVPIDAVSDGFHILSIRSRDANSKWSVVQTRPFYKLSSATVNAPNLSRIEYYVDTDPGYGLATEVTFTPGSSVADLVFQVDVTSVIAGPHKIFVRSQDANNMWSIIQIQDFSVCEQEPPVSLAATNIGATGFTANWNAATSSTGYKLDVSADNFATFVSGFNDLSESGTSKGVTGLTAGTAYKYRVRSTGSCTSVNSAPIDVSTLFTAPVATAATSISSTGFSANWNAVANAADYRLDVSADDFTSLLPGYDNLVVATTTQAVTGLSPSTTYKFRVRAVSNGSATSGNSNEISATTLALPNAPIANAATSVTSTSFTANWSGVGGATGYRLDVSEDNFATMLAGFSDKTVATTSDAITGLSPGTSYKYRVRTESGTGVSPNSNVIDVTTAPPAPQAPVATAATEISSSGFTANWTASVDATGYELDVSDDNFTTFVAGYSSKAVLNLTELVTGLSANTTYSYRVRATNVSGVSVSSNVIDLTTLETPTETPVATAATAVGLTSFTANWLAASGATGYELDVSADNFSTFVAGFNSFALTSTSAIVGGLTQGTTYAYRVRATSALPTSDNSNDISVTTLLPQMPAPIATAATGITQDGFTATWNAAAGAAGYELDVSLDNFATFAAGFNSLAVTGTNAPVTGLTASTSYKYRVRATGAQPVSVNSNVIDVTTLVAQMETPTATAATEVTPTGFFANWNLVDGATGYQLDVSVDNFVTFLPAFNSNAVVGPSEQIAGLTAGTVYQYRVRATGTLPVSANSNVIVVTTLPKASQSITFPAIVDKTMGDGPFAVGATASSGLSVSYAIASTHITITGGQATLVSAGRETIEASQPGDGAFKAATTVTQSFCINPAKPTVTIANANTANVTLTSSASTGNQWYKDGTAMSGATNNTLSVTTEGVYKVQAKVDDCVSAFSSDTEIIVTGVQLEHSSISLMYPNPAKDKLFVDLRGFESGKPVHVKVTDFLGRGIHKQDAGGGTVVEIDVTAYATGAYLLSLVQDTKSVQVKFVKD